MALPKTPALKPEDFHVVLEVSARDWNNEIVHAVFVGSPGTELEFAL